MSFVKTEDRATGEHPHMTVLALTAGLLQRAVDDVIIGIAHGALHEDLTPTGRHPDYPATIPLSNGVYPRLKEILDAVAFLHDWRGEHACDLIAIISGVKTTPAFWRNRARRMAMAGERNFRSASFSLLAETTSMPNAANDKRHADAKARKEAA